MSRCSGPRESGKVEQREIEQRIPGEGVADAAIERVGPVFSEAQDVGRGFGAGELAE